MASSSPGLFFYAFCDSTEHTDNETWAGVRREDHDDALKDAIEHNAATGHQAIVMEE